MRSPGGSDRAFDWLFCHSLLFYVAAKAWYDGMYVWLVQLSAHTDLYSVQRKASVSRLHQNQLTFVLVSNYGVPKFSKNPFLKGFIRSEKEIETICFIREVNWAASSKLSQVATR